MNQNVASYPSVLGVPDCIEERVNFDASLAQVVGSSARWSSYESRYQSGVVTGSAFLTPELRAWRESHEATFVSLALGRAFWCTLTQWESRADSQGRAIVSYSLFLRDGVSDLPRRDALFALFVPRWQTVEERNVVKDFVGDKDLTPVGSVTWTDDGLSFDTTTRGNYMISPQFSFIRNKFTILVDRELNTRPEGQSLGLRMVYNLNNEYANETMTMYRNASEITVEVAGHDNRISMSAVVPDGYSVLTNTHYNGVPVVEGGGRRVWRRIDINVYHIYNQNYRRPMWAKFRALAIWTDILTEEEIETAKLYLKYAPRPSS